MEEITEAVNNINLAAPGDSYKKNRIQVSNTKKPLFFYVNLAKRYMQQHNEVELSALGMAIATVVTVAEILKNNGLAVEKKIMTSTVDMKDDSRGRPIQKAKVMICYCAYTVQGYTMGIHARQFYAFLYCLQLVKGSLYIFMWYCGV
ncbi:uncharacterized protein At2g34160 isoform X1 [Cannabis sativa]|uniref:uncharacterized protein At2g34160 isoform X1 n=1 Tax=Cannabis sativa TaxID=3483 RepID=UPI0029C9D1AE|nr:uncharacterized protein At2g34160 isoform X1 [Cannabis sativa]